MHKRNWEDIRYVLTVARLGSTNAAATELGVTHTTVMRRVAAFELSYGQKIFQKSSTGYKLLPEANPIVRSMESVEEATLALERSIAGADQSPSGQVRIASTDSLSSLILPAIVAKIIRRFPKIEISLLSANLHHDLSRLSADIVVRPTVTLSDDLSGEEVGKLVFAAYGNGAPCDNWLKMEGALSASIAAQWMDTNVPQTRLVSGSDSFLALGQLAASGVGKTVLPDFVGNSDPRLVQLDDVKPDISVSIWVATLKEFAHVPRFAQVKKMLISELRRTSYLAS